ncbi:MAG TPA: DMT family transporter [Rhodocyclaceae bacterium]|nr:DMT family transporter [Rhodocyclaceae bacterium]
MDTLPVTQRKTIPILCLLTAATVWGLVWYPYRVLEAEGMSGIEASVLTYLTATTVGLILWRKQLRAARITPMLIAIALAGGACNLGYVAATLLGEIARVLLLFYLSPLWTVIFARLILRERLTAISAAVIVVSLCGAGIMLWHPEEGLPWPASMGEWLGLGAGVFFSLSNVLGKKAGEVSIELKSLAIFVGAVVLGSLAWPFFPNTEWQLPGTSWLMLAVVGGTIAITNVLVQYAITQTQAAHAIVVLLFELVVAAVASWFLAGETLGLRDWIGGGLIIGASLLSMRISSGH